MNAKELHGKIEAGEMTYTDGMIYADKNYEVLNQEWEACSTEFSDKNGATIEFFDDVTRITN